MALKKSLKKEAETKAVEAETKAVEAETKAVEAETKAVEAETKAVEAETKVAEAETKVAEAETKVAEAETKVAEAETKTLTIHNDQANPPTNMTEYVKEAAEEGFEGMDVGGLGTFPIIVLETDGKFSCDDEEWGSDPFTGQIQSTQKLYLFKQAGVEKGDVAYSHDGIKLDNVIEECTTREALENLWKEEGFSLECKEYREVTIEITQDGHDHNGEFFIAKLPPMSIRAFNGQVFIAKNKLQKKLNRQVSFNEVILEFGVGSKRTSGTNKYYPWKFKPAIS